MLINLSPNRVLVSSTMETFCQFFLQNTKGRSQIYEVIDAYFRGQHFRGYKGKQNTLGHYTVSNTEFEKDMNLQKDNMENNVKNC